jgi:hypothetical protein
LVYQFVGQEDIKENMDNVLFNLKHTCVICKSDEEGIDTPACRGIEANCGCKNVCVKCQMKNFFEGNLMCPKCDRDLGEFTQIEEYDYIFDKNETWNDSARSIGNMIERYPEDLYVEFDTNEEECWDVYDRCNGANNFETVYEILMSYPYEKGEFVDYYHDFIDKCLDIEEVGIWSTFCRDSLDDDSDSEVEEDDEE